MTIEMEFPSAAADKIITSENLEQLSGEELLDLFRKDAALQQNLPGSQVHYDPRTAEAVVFNPSRASRPKHKSADVSCPICEGKSTPIIDREPLSSGFSFINQNLFPAVFPHEPADSETHQNQTSGLHFIQWTSSVHNAGWDNMPLPDLEVVLHQLGRLEKHLLELTFPGKIFQDERFISIIKNAGILSGGSIAHDHQQIILSDALPGKKAEHLRFLKENGLVFSEHMLNHTPADLFAADLGEAVLLVPQFMRRPYNLMLIVKDTQKQHLHQLTHKETAAVSQGWKWAIKAIKEIMPQIGKEISYNVLTHSGPGAGLYFEFLPHSQTNGGFERMGLSICQASPELCAQTYREIFKQA